MTIEHHIAANPDASDAEIANAVNAEPSRFRPVASNAVLEWLAGGARLAKLEGWIAAAADSADANVIGLRAALRVLLMSASNPNAYLSLEPGTDQRTLLSFAVQAQAITQGDADALLAKATLTSAVTEAEVTSERARVALRQARDALVGLKMFASAYRDQVNAATSIETLPAEVSSR